MNPKIEAYFKKHDHPTFHLLREVILQTEVSESLKWGMPTYTSNGKNIVAIGAFKKHFAIWFFQGVFLKDKHKKLRNAQKGKTKSMRQWRVEKNETLDKDVLFVYVKEAIKNQKDGKQIKPSRKKPELMALTKDLKVFFQTYPTLIKNFEQLSESKKNDCIEYVSSAKRLATRKKRMDILRKLLPKGMSPMDQYKK